MAGFKIFSARGLLFSLVLAFLTACPSDDLSVFGLKLVERKLSNGLKLLVIQQPDSPVISYQTWFHVGSVDEVPGQSGLAHLFEHLYFKGNADLEARGAEVNAYTTRDFTVFHEQFSPELLTSVIEMESRRMAGLELDAKTLEAEKWVIFEERLLRLESAPEVRLQEALWSHAFERHPYAWPVMGVPQDLAQASVETARAFFEQYYRPSNASIVVVGPDSPEALLTRLEAAYETLPKRPAPLRYRFVEPEQKEERRFKIQDSSLSATRMGIAFPIPSAHDADAYALDVLAQILFDSESARAQRRLIQEKPLALSVAGAAYTPGQPGLFLVTGVLRRGVASADFENEVQKLFEEVAAQGVSVEEIQSAVKLLTLQLMESARSPFGLGQFIGTVQTLFDDPKRFVQDLRRYQAVSQEDVQRVATRYFGLNRRTVVVMSR